MKNGEELPSYIHFTKNNGWSLIPIQKVPEQFPPVEFSTYNVIRESLLKEIARTTRLEAELKTLKEKYNE